MATVKENSSNEIFDCDPKDPKLKEVINSRISRQTSDLDEFRTKLQAYQTKIASSTDPVIQKFDRATSFPADEIRAMLENSDCRYIRVYNGLDEDQFTTFIAPLNEQFALLEDSDLMIVNPCCHCNPCKSDMLLKS